MLFLSSLTVKPVNAATVVSASEPMTFEFNTSVVGGSSIPGGVLDILLVTLNYRVFPVRNGSAGVPFRAITMAQGESRTVSNSVNVSIFRDGRTFQGTFNYTISYNSVTSALLVNGAPVPLSTRITINTPVFLEALVQNAVVGVEMVPQPFSRINATSGMNAQRVADFNNMLNQTINQNILLVSSRLGTPVQSNTRLSMFVNH